MHGAALGDAGLRARAAVVELRLLMVAVFLAVLLPAGGESAASTRRLFSNPCALVTPSAVTRLANGSNAPMAASRPRAWLRLAISASRASSYSSWALVSDHQIRSSGSTESVFSQ